jgi:peptide/nickel transport system substrate-binding protein
VRSRRRRTPGVEVIDATTISSRSEQPDFTILNAMSADHGSGPQEEVERLGDAKFGQTPVGFGPFKVESYDGANQRAIFVRNEDYMYPGLPYLDEIEYRWGVDANLQMLQLQNGDCDLVGDGVPRTGRRRSPTLS